MVLRIERHQSIRLPVRQRIEQYAVDHGKERRVRPDAQRQREHCNCSEGRVLAQLPQRIANVLKQSAHLRFVLLSRTTAPQCAGPYQGERITPANRLVSPTARLLPI